MGKAFPAGFRWGCATSAYQNEGGNTNSDWWQWEQGAGHVAGGQHAGRACDWWGEGFEQDLAWMERLRLNALRLSVEWSRIEPSEGRFDDAVLERYRNMLRSLVERGIEPLVTLHHFSNPIWLAEQGGWTRPEAVARFERFVRRAVSALGEFCNQWVTVNEPTIYAILGYLQPPVTEDRPRMTFAPGSNDLSLALRVMGHMLLGHAAAYRAIHEIQPAATVGLAHHMQVLDPMRRYSLLDRAVLGVHDWIMNTSVIEALRKGRLPSVTGWRREPALRGTVDFIGLNYYSRELVAFDARSPATAFGRRFLDPKGPLSDGRFSQIHPAGLSRLLRRLAVLGCPIRITENGVPDDDDDIRPAFIADHLRVLRSAIADGRNVEGYYHWTLTDNFEWAEGWNLRFGLVRLDPATQRRTLRPSGTLYAAICESNGEALPEAVAAPAAPAFVPTPRPARP